MCSLEQLISDLSFSCLVPHGVCKPWQDSEESGKLESGWHMKSFLKCHCLWHEGLLQCLCLPSGPFSDRCSWWTSFTAFLTSIRPTLCQSRMPVTEEGGFACTHRTRGILVNEQQGPPLLQKEWLNALIYCHHWTRNMKNTSFPIFLCPDTWTLQCPLGWGSPWIARKKCYS